MKKDAIKSLSCQPRQPGTSSSPGVLQLWCKTINYFSFAGNPSLTVSQQTERGAHSQRGSSETSFLRSSYRVCHFSSLKTAFFTRKKWI